MRGIVPPGKATCAKYGLTQEEWLRILADQGWVCAICENGNVRWNTDHEHVPGWRRMSDARRRLYVRGVLCWRCNRHLLPADMTLERAKNVVRYLTDFAARRPR